MKVFGFSDYKAFLKHQVALNRAQGGYKTTLANAAGCKPSFLSHVLHTHVHLTPDHAVGLALYWGFNDLEQDYFLELVNLERAGSKTLTEHIKRKLESILEKQENLAARFQKKKPVTDSEQHIYYSSWHYSAIHILLTIPQFQSSRAISQRLNLPIEFVKKALNELDGMGLAAYTDDRWQATKRDIHLPRDSHLTTTNHFNWRNRAIEHAQTTKEQGIHYTAVHSLSKKDFERIKQLLLESLDKSRGIVGPSKEEEIACMTLDWFLI